LYFSVFEWPKDGKLVIPGLKNKVVSAKMLAGGATLTSKTSGNALTINVPAQAPDAIASVIKVELKGKVKDVTVEKNGKMKSGELD
jgi:alpha-L-fucosidase